MPNLILSREFFAQTTSESNNNDHSSHTKLIQTKFNVGAWTTIISVLTAGRSPGSICNEMCLLDGAYLLKLYRRNVPSFYSFPSILSHFSPLLSPLVASLLPSFPPSSSLSLPPFCFPLMPSVPLPFLHKSSWTIRGVLCEARAFFCCS